VDNYVIFAFNGNPTCFIHVLLNALDMQNEGIETKVIIEGEAVKLIREMDTTVNPFYLMAKEKGLIDGICKACSAKMGVLEFNETVGIPLVGDMSGHPPIAAYVKKGCQVITL
jgi:hypothetical protein